MRLERHLKLEEWEWEAGVVSLATRLEKYTVDTPYMQAYNNSQWISDRLTDRYPRLMTQARMHADPTMWRIRRRQLDLEV